MLLFGACEDGNGVAGRAGTVTSQESSSTTATTNRATTTTIVTTVTSRHFPPETQIRHGERSYAVFVAVERTSSAPELAHAKEELRKAGYRVSPGAGDINCNQGAREALGLTPGVDYFVEAVYFRTRQEAQQFVDALEPAVVGTALVTLYCLD
jgi:hypothetical protein